MGVIHLWIGGLIIAPLVVLHFFGNQAFPIFIVEVLIMQRISFLKCRACGKRMFEKPSKGGRTKGFEEMVIFDNKCPHCGESQNIFS